MRLRKATSIRLVVIAAIVVTLEVLCRTGAIRRFTMIPPSEMEYSTLFFVKVVGGALFFIGIGVLLYWRASRRPRMQLA